MKSVPLVKKKEKKKKAKKKKIESKGSSNLYTSCELWNDTFFRILYTFSRIFATAIFLRSNDYVFYNIILIKSI